ncbi:type II CRISPR RNA-guided endonuclease Cas9 [Corynebacterium matruchotii]|uniref:type II CRISPR RNA-guided endonuclease Cas9 n=1 Tax=Corynebacterium matruchotii TaxID=43768 RepID=UPI002E0FC416|nr:type II CRISPR RNA-guided endonuclease Cas9 [Corynebacterium matruchotii]
MTSANVNYRVGIDVGSYSIGMAAIAIDDDGKPTEILSAISLIHDSGVDPDSAKSAATRLATSGIARRTRRLYRRKRKRLAKLDKFISSQGWPLKEFEEYEDPFYPWRVRAELATTPITDQQELGEKLSIALRHIARHRGWRNPYSKVTALYTVAEPSDALVSIQEQCATELGRPIPPTTTVGQLIASMNLGKTRLRGEDSLLAARPRQSDNANEIHAIAKVQGLSNDLVKQIIDHVFAAESPKGSAAERVGKDPLQPTKKRALKASDAFQRYRIAALIGNLRIRGGKKNRRLTTEETRLVFDYLRSLPAKQEPTWQLVAEQLKIDRGNLVGTAIMTDDGERAGARPPVHETNRLMESTKIKPLATWWKSADADARAAMVKALSNAEVDDFDSQAGAQVQEFFFGISDEDQEKLDGLHLPIGRAAYSEDTLDRLTKRMIGEGMDLYEARQAEFKIPNDWAPPAPEIGERVGNPAVDRVLKATARWLNAAERQWGAPKSINIEHVRAAFMSESSTRELDRDNQQRAKRNVKVVAEMQEKLGIEGRPSRADVWRFQSIQRQNGKCAYCGTQISYTNSEMDHIVPQAGEGSTNTRDNLVAVCRECNSSKSNIAFAVWAENTSRPGVSVQKAVERTRHWVTDSGLRKPEFDKFRKQVCDRLRRKATDEPIDARSLESVAWMANELRSRIAQKFKDGDTKVRVYKGALTAEARRASGISGKLEFVDGKGKSRLDRRHHAVDAAVVAFMSHYVAETLALRSNMKFDQELRRKAPQWREFTGSDHVHQVEWTKWKYRMQALAELLNNALAQDRIVVMHNLRLRLGNGAAHEDTIGKLTRIKVGDAISTTDIDRASSEALWCALTRDPDFDPKTGLPENPNRTIRIHETHLTASDEITVFPVAAASVPIRDGFAKLGSNYHHVRLFRVPNGKKYKYCLMQVYTVDLLKFRKEDLFTVELKPQTISVRTCEAPLRKALANGTAEYLGWLVSDDELLIDTSSFDAPGVAKLREEYGPVNRWRLAGLTSVTRLNLRPLYLSKEGLKPDVDPEIKKIIDNRSWIITVNKLFSIGHVKIIRRDALGRPRLYSAAHLPICWEVK